MNQAIAPTQDHAKEQPKTQVRSQPKDHPGAQSLPSTRTSYKRSTEQHFLPTLFDRLTDEAPHESSENTDSYAYSRSRIRAIVLRDLALLLNTTNHQDWIDATRYAQVAQSTFNYGVPALAGGYLSETKWGDIEIMIRNAIQQFEPRILATSLQVNPVLKKEASNNYNVLTFIIHGVIQMHPYPMEFSVQSAYDLESNRIELHPLR
jgi:type VI secretion system protein ImpF